MPVNRAMMQYGVEGRKGEPTTIKCITLQGCMIYNTVLLSLNYAMIKDTSCFTLDEYIKADGIIQYHIKFHGVSHCSALKPYQGLISYIEESQILRDFICTIISQHRS